MSSVISSGKDTFVVIELPHICSIEFNYLGVSNLRAGYSADKIPLNGARNGKHKKSIR